MSWGEPTAATSQVRDRLSAALLFAGVVALLTVGGAQLAKDGSLWRDEASVAVSLLELSPAELLGRLEGGQSFPRVYLLAVAGLSALFGYETLVLRALPFSFFALGVLAWSWLLARRFRGEPLVLAMGMLLTAIPATWFVQAAMFKPYTFDLLAALVPFLLRDSFYTAVLQRGERPWRIVAVTAVGALSYPFALAFTARLVGWWVSRVPRGELAVHPGGAAAALGGLVTFGACLWLTDLRHTAELSALLGLFWQKCLLVGTEAPPALVLLDRFAFGWYTGGANFSQAGGLPDIVANIVRLAFLAGALRIALVVLGVGRAGVTASPAWGSRSLGFAALVCGVLCASLLSSYPICPGRLTLFALPALQIVTLEGLSWLVTALGRLPGGRTVSLVAGVALVAALAPTALRDARHLVASGAPDDLRAGLARMREKPELPMITTTCTTRQIETLPEEIEHTVFFTGPGVDLSPALAAGEAWILHSPAPYCKNQIRSLRTRATSWDEVYKHAFASRLIHAEFAGRAPRR